MKTSDSRILTTHMGSLPRGEVLSDLLVAKDNEEAVDEARFALKLCRDFFAERFGGEPGGGRPRADSGGGVGLA